MEQNLYNKYEKIYLDFIKKNNVYDYYKEYLDSLKETEDSIFPHLMPFDTIKLREEYLHIIIDQYVNDIVEIIGYRFINTDEYKNNPNKFNDFIYNAILNWRLFTKLALLDSRFGYHNNSSSEIIKNYFLING